MLIDINHDVTNVTDVQSINSNSFPDTSEAVTAVTDSLESVPFIPEADKRPCFVVIEDWHVEKNKTYRPGVYYFTSRMGKNNEPPSLIDQWVCSPIIVSAITSDGQGNNFGRFIRYRNTLGAWREWAMPMELLRGSGEELRGELLSMGVEIDPQYRNLLSTYLQSEHPTRKMLSAQQVGWCGGSFVLPDAVIGPRASEVIFQTGERNNDEYTTAGTLAGWQNEIAAHAVKNALLATSLSAAFAGALLSLCNAESGGFHYTGDSSSGKTGLIEAACSVWGGDNYKRGWRTTANGMEGVAAMFNDGLLALDEISECDSHDVGSIVYSLGNGRGKQRASRTGNARSIKRWRCMVLSSGERTIETTMAEGGHRIKAGQNTRLPSVPVSRRFGVYDDLCGLQNGAALTDSIKSAAKLHCGHAGREFLERLTRDTRDFPAYLSGIKAMAFNVPNSDGQVKRVAARFALVAMAGELATIYGITGWPPCTATLAVAETFKSWLSTCNGAGNNESHQIVERLSSFIERHGDARFSSVDFPSGMLIRDRAGWWRDDGEHRIYLFTSGGLREALKGFDFRRALDELQELGIIQCPAGHGERAKSQRINGRLIKLYHINTERLG